MNDLSIVIENQLIINLWVYLSLSIHNMTTLMPTSHFFLLLLYILVKLEIRKCLSTLFFCKVVFVILGLLNFHMHFRNNLFISAKKPTGALIGAALNR